MHKLKILFLIPHPIQGASSRHRVYQYLPFLEKEGIGYRVSPFVSESFYKILYKKGFFFKKICFIFSALLRRIFDCFFIFFSDVIFIHLESSPFPILFLEHVAHFFNKPIIFDFDDAIFLKRSHAIHNFRLLLKSHRIPPKLISMSTQVIVGNPYLKTYASQHIADNRVTVLPTTIDVKKFPFQKQNRPDLIIGWIGMHTTFSYFEKLLPIFPEIAQRYPFTLKIIGAPKKIELPGVQIVQKEWHLSEEIDDILSFDIGLYPLFDPHWDQGKASFKALLYMAAYVPCIASDVGRNKDVIQDGKNGFLVSSKDQWIEKIILLLKSQDLRHQLATEGRKTVENYFSVEQHTQTFIRVLQKTANPL